MSQSQRLKLLINSFKQMVNSTELQIMFSVDIFQIHCKRFSVTIPAMLHRNNHIVEVQ